MRWQAPHQGIVQTPPRRGKTFALPLWWPANSEFAIGTSSTWKQAIAWQAAIQAAPHGSDVTIRSEPRCPPLSGRSIRGFR
jgi:hypothetical protein